MEDWWVDEDRLFKQGKKLIPTHEFKTPYKMLIVMLRRLYGKEKSTHFQMEWLPMAYTIVKMGQVFNWEEILTFNIFLNMKNIPGMKKPCFYMSAYLIDAIYSSIQFPALDGIGTKINLLVHIYCSNLWNINYKKYLYNICDYFLAPLYTIIFGFPRYKISKEAMAGMKGIEYWYLGKYYTYIRVYGSTGAPHLFPYFVQDHLLMREISYQTMGTGVTSLLLSNSKKLWPLFPVHIGNYSLSNGPHARKEAETLQEICLCIGEARGHDPHELEVSHVRYVGLTHSNIHVVDFDEEVFKGVLFYEEVLQKLPNDVARQEMQLEQEEKRRILQSNFKCSWMKTRRSWKPRNKKK
jgi:hypothetical protein